MQRLLRMHVFTVLACVLILLAFAHVNILGLNYPYNCCFCGYIPYIPPIPLDDGEDGGIGEGHREKSDDYSWEYHFRHGWPTAFGEHAEKWTYDSLPPPNVVEAGPPLLRRVIRPNWTSFRTDSVMGAMCDVFLSLILITATGVVVLRLERKRWRHLQFSIADLFSLIATTSMVLGLVCLDSRLSIGEESAVEGMYVRMRDLPLFDRVITLFAIACAVWLIVSTAANRLGDKYAKNRP